MIYVDDREAGMEGRIRATGMEASTLRLEYGDAMFEGNGPDGTCCVGFERKKLGDLVASMKDRRLSGHQLRGCLKAYDFVYLVSEGIWREGTGGEIEELRGKDWRALYERGNGGHAISYEQLDHYLCSLELKAGVIVKRTRDERETARFYVSRWRWFNQKTWDQHKSHDQIYTGLPAKGHGTNWGRRHEHDGDFSRAGTAGRTQIGTGDPTTCWLAASVLPGIDRKAETVARHFGTVRKMANATERDWMAIDFGVKRDGSGQRNAGIGPVTAKAVVRAITEEGA